MDPVVVVDKPVEERDKKRSRYVEKNPNAEHIQADIPEGEHPEETHNENREKRDHKDHRDNRDNRDNREKGEGKERRQRRREPDNEEYKINAEDINEDTVVPKLPKKNEILKQPERTEYKDRETKIIDKIKAAREKRAKVLAERYEVGKKGSDGKFDEFEELREEVNNLRKDKEEAYAELKLINDKLKDIQDDIKEIDAELSTVGGDHRGREENIFEKLRRIEQDLTSRKLTPKEEKDLTFERDILRRQINAVSSKNSGENAEVRLDQLRDRRSDLNESLKDLYDDKKPVSEKYATAKEKYTPAFEKFSKMRDEKKSLRETERTEFDDAREEFNEKKTKKKEAINVDIDKLRDSIDDLWKEYETKTDEFYKQQRFIKHVDWVTRQKEKIVKHKDWEKRQKDREDRQKEEVVIKPKKYTQHIRNCQTLIDYCRRLRPEEEHKAQKAVEKLTTEEIQGKMSADKQWEKGVTLIQSKKNQDLDIEIGKKNKKNKKAEIPHGEKEKSKGPAHYSHDINVLNAFESVNVLFPNTIEDLDNTTKALEEKLVQYEKMNEEQQSEEHRPEQPSEKEAPKKKAQEQKPTKLQIKEEDFPQL